jgi:hypothetical protein
MSRPKQKTKFWAILFLVNLAGIVYPISLCTNAESIEQQISALLVVVGTGLVLAAVDAACALIAYS